MIGKDLTYISLFSSAGVGCYGFKEAGFKCIATNELIERRLNIQRINNKCEYPSGYIAGDIKKQAVQNKIFTEIKRWKQLGNEQVDVLIATPPCQGMSVANHKKSENEIERNSLVVESIKIIKEIEPKIFIFENVPAFNFIAKEIPKEDFLEARRMIGDKMNTIIREQTQVRYDGIINDYKDYKKMNV